jgi:hypothetical protein
MDEIERMLRKIEHDSEVVAQLKEAIERIASGRKGNGTPFSDLELALIRNLARGMPKAQPACEELEAKLGEDNESVRIKCVQGSIQVWYNTDSSLTAAALNSGDAVVWDGHMLVEQVLHYFEENGG